MAKLMEYVRAYNFDVNDILIKDGINGTKKIFIEDVLKYIFNKLGDTTLGDGNKFAVAQAVGDSFDQLKADTERQLNELSSDMLESVNSGYVDEQGYLYLTHDGEVVVGPLGPFNGGGGGTGGNNNAVLTFQKASSSAWGSKTVSSGADCYVTVTWSSLEDEAPTGNGVLTIRVNNIVKKTMDVSQGNITLNLKDYISEANNKVKLVISDAYDNQRQLNYTVNIATLTLQSSFDASMPFPAGTDISYTYTPIGAVEKTVRFLVDGSVKGTQVVTASGRQQSYLISNLTHGRHRLEVYFTGEINGEAVQSNHLVYELIVVDENSHTPIIASTYSNKAATQYETVTIPYKVYTPDSLTSSVSFYVNNQLISNASVDRTEQEWSYRFDGTGNYTLSIVSGTARMDFPIAVAESDIDAKAETQDLVLYLTSTGRSNNESNPGVWEDTENSVSATMTGFNFVSDGWIKDKDGNTALRVGGDARVSIPYKPFQNDFRTTGKTIEIEFASRNVLNYDAVLISCWSGNRGFSITAQRAIMKSEQSEIFTDYKEDEHVRISFVTEKRNESRLLMIYINGIMSGVVRYPEDDDFSQQSPVNITIGSSESTTDIYNIRVYDNNLTRYQILDNWIADTQSITEMVRRYEHNNVYNTSKDDIDINKLPSDLPYMVLQAPALPAYKGNKLKCDGYYLDPVNDNMSFSFEGAQIDVQGTSSQYYPRKNYKIKFKNGFKMTKSGETISKYSIRADAIPVSTFCFKADVASSEGANNVELARLYNDACPYKTPGQKSTTGVRQGIDGFPIVIFWDNGESVSFVGKYNFNNDKGTEKVFGFVDGDESWEIRNNTGNRVLWKSNDYDGTAWLNDFEARFPDLDPPYTDPSQLRDFSTWLMSTDPDTATGNALPSPVTYTETIYPDEDSDVGQIVTRTYTNDTAEYRISKFKAEAGNYMELDSAFFYYLFTELFLMVDSRAKNAFPSFMGTEVN